ncbi:DUF5825 family protein [Streptomyces sp. XD-27]|uniref:DUF5825 family protein n=1 Tax=Streptomyces sp. XD-27 TaxID=3062779 RepID=UPI0026F42C74|nr:DUF5825 family protein [Streptomyces sp. XD-27]WKX73914.1 DUF5825 family protein [Streptomyces sp. XD-27]
MTVLDSPLHTAPILPHGPAHQVTGRHVVVEEPLRLGAHGRSTVDAVWFLRECQTQALTVDWSLAPWAAQGTNPAGLPFDLTLLRHLPPPAPTPGESAEVIEWRTLHTYGQFFHRRGPGFVTVKDRRDTSASARFTLDHPDLVATFLKCQTPQQLGTLAPVEQEAVTLMAAERITLSQDGWVVALPSRMRIWPVPHTGI